jgi:hypothetical protein
LHLAQLRQESTKRASQAHMQDAELVREKMILRAWVLADQSLAAQLPKQWAQPKLLLDNLQFAHL